MSYCKAKIPLTLVLLILENRELGTVSKFVDFEMAFLLFLFKDNDVQLFYSMNVQHLHHFDIIFCYTLPLLFNNEHSLSSVDFPTIPIFMTMSSVIKFAGSLVFLKRSIRS